MFSKCGILFYCSFVMAISTLLAIAVMFEIDSLHLSYYLALYHTKGTPNTQYCLISYL